MSPLTASRSVWLNPDEWFLQIDLPPNLGGPIGRFEKLRAMGELVVVHVGEHLGVVSKNEGYEDDQAEEPEQAEQPEEVFHPVVFFPS